MLGLLTPTDPHWVDAVEGNLDGLLDDHSHCELKAAQSALALLGRWGGTYPALVAPLLALAHEEAEHFAEVRAHADARGGRLSSPAADTYVLALREATKDGASDRPKLLDRLLVCALIEARSCERFKLLSERLSSAELRGFYRELMTSEARHYRLYGDLAEQCFGVEDTRARLKELAMREGAIAHKLPLGPTVHG